MRIAKPLLLIATPIGVIAGVREAWRFHWWLALLMVALVAVISAFFGLTWWYVRKERNAP
jgi:hypothetical protein